MTARRPRAAGSWLAFLALALYGTARWGTMLETSEQGRLFGALAVALVCALVVRRLPGGRAQYLSFLALVLIGFVVLLAVAGFPLRWLLGLHFRALATALDHGVSALPGVLVPYRGGERATAEVMVLGAAALLLAAGLAFGSVRGRPGTGQLALSALPLLVLVVVPTAVVSPRVSFFHGMITFLLVALLVFSPRIAPARRGGAAALIFTAIVVGTVAAGLLGGKTPWLRVGTGHGGGAGHGAEVFDWEQTYGAQGWPESGATVFTVNAPHPAYWKAEDLDSFNGRAWTAGSGRETGVDGTLDVSRATVARYTETLSFHVQQLSSQLVIGAGDSGAPNVIGVVPGTDAGTWKTYITLQAGMDYRLSAYVPDPSAAQMAAAGSGYPAAVEPFRTTGALPAAYAPVRALAQRLAAGTSDPYQYVQAVLDYLRHGYVYTLDPPRGGADPLVSFLLHTKRGYCQQFAGATALLLRMRGIPARVAVGFSTGSRQAKSDTYLVSDTDAHAWVEVWFPGYGWVTFDPTPGTATAGGSDVADVASIADTASTPASASSVPTATATTTRPVQRANSHGLGGAASGAGSSRAAAGSGGTLVTAVAILGGLVLAGIAAMLARRYWRRPSVEELTAELERAFARSGRPLAPEVTLASLQKRMDDNPQAAAYVAALTASRYGATDTLPTARERAALRRWLALGLGPGGYARALWAIPPQRGPRHERAPASGGDRF